MVLGGPRNVQKYRKILKCFENFKKTTKVSKTSDLCGTFWKDPEQPLVGMSRLALWGRGQEGTLGVVGRIEGELEPLVYPSLLLDE